MNKIFINALNVKTGGGKSILINFLKQLKKKDINDTFFVLTPNKSNYLEFENEFIKIIELSQIYKKNIFLPYIYNIIIPKLLQKLNIDIVFNMSSFGIKTNLKQIFLFQWPYAVYPESIVWKKMDIKSHLIRKTKLFMFKQNLRYIDKMIAQTETMKKRLEKIYNIKNIEIVPNAVSVDNIDGGGYKDFKLPNGIKLLYLTYYYPHKNLEIFIPLAKEIKKQKLDFKIVITIDETQHQKAKEFLKNIKPENLEDVIINLGPIEMKNVPSLYKQVDGLLMPTLLESFSGTYVEAMYHKVPIFTSNFDFARDVCKDIAFYFNPFDEKDILNKLKFAFGNKEEIENKVEKGYELVYQMDSWEDTIEKYLKIINDLKESK